MTVPMILTRYCLLQQHISHLVCLLPLTSPGIKFWNLLFKKQNSIDLVHLRHPSLNAVT